MASSITLPDGFNIIFVSIKRWHGKRKLNNEDLGIEAIDNRLANLGNVSMIDPKMINQFRNLSNKAKTLCDRYGIQFGEGWAIHDDVYNIVMDELKSIQSSWYAAKREVMSKYEINVQLWANEAESLKKGFGEVVLRGAYSASYVESQIQFEIHGAEQVVAGLGNSLIEEIAKKFKKKHEQLVQRYADNKDFNITRRDLILLNEVKDKLLINALLSPASEPLLEFISNILDESGDADQPLTDDFCDLYVRNIALLTTPELIFGLKSTKTIEETTAPIGISSFDLFDGNTGLPVEDMKLEDETLSDSEHLLTVENQEPVNDSEHLVHVSASNDESEDKYFDYVVEEDEYSQAPLNPQDRFNIFTEFEDF
ncbi:TPA: DUF3150 domain-containing protein [Photobacterium damselae]